MYRYHIFVWDKLNSEWDYTDSWKYEPDFAEIPELDYLAW